MAFTIHTQGYIVMASEKTPAHKRISRAEKSRDDWKNKAQLRREENEKLKRDLESKVIQSDELKIENQSLKEELQLFQKKSKNKKN